MKRKILCPLFFLLFFFCQDAFALDLQVTATNETCTGNGSLSFSVTNQTVGVPVFYNIYLLPNTTTPIATVSTNSYGGLVAGSYLVIASQTVGNTTTTAQQNVVIENQIVALTFTIAAIKVKCGNDGQITVNITSGVAVSYQLLSGPVTTGVQSNNVFQNLPVGQYDIRVFDSCGEGVVQTFTLTNITPLVTIGSPVLNNPNPIVCDSMTINHLLSSSVNTQIFYPLTVQVTATPPSGGTPVVTTQTVTGSPLTVTVPSINGVSYLYDILITDACGNVFIRNNNTFSAIFNFNVEILLENCNDYVVKFTPVNFKAPYTVNFISAPAGFNPVLCNSNHPGPFSGNFVIYGTSPNYMPLGVYTVEITDSCGFTKTKTFNVVDVPSSPISVVNATGCGENGNLSIGLSPSRPLATVILNSAPPAYTNTLPEDLSSLIFSNGVFYFQDIPLGTYVFDLVDVCGNTYTHTVVLAGTPETPLFEQKPGCVEGDASVRIFFPNASIATIEIQEAPTTFGFSLPYNVSFNIVNGEFFMNSLTAGNYKFKITDNCGFVSFVNMTLIGYTTTNSVYNVTENCGSFNLQLNHTSNGTYLTSYWLQKYDPINNVWEHPSTGVDYIPGSNITNANAFPLVNNSNNLNLAFSGTFRVVKMFYNFSNGTFVVNRCVLSLYEFEFTGGPKIIDAYSFPCANNLQEVVIIATGLPPLQYSIIEKNGLPFVINNGNSNTFANLDAASYKFEVTDVCGNVVNRIFDVSLLSEPQIIASNLCNGVNGQFEIQNFPFVTYQWYNTQNPSVILSTTSTLPFAPFDSQNDIGTYAVQLSTTNPNSCVNQTITYTINDSGFNPNAGDDANLVFCKESQSISLNSLLSNPHDAGGTWTDANGDVVTNTTINPINFNAGNYQYTYTVGGLCTSSDLALISITIKDLPSAPVLSAPDPICRGEEIQLNASLITNASYFWTGPNGFTSTDQNPIIQNYDANNDGDYYVFVEVDGCNSSTEQITLNSNPLAQFSIDGSTTICIGQNEDLTINPVGFDINLALVNWYYNGVLLTNETSSTLQINQIGIYSVVIDYEGCISENEVEVIEKVNSFQVVLEQGCNEKDYEINIVNTQDFPSATYSWTGPNGFVSFNPNIIVPNLQIGTYTVEVTNSVGCKSSASALVENTNCFIPNGFSPDDDGINDSFDLSGYNVKKISIYNRYGRLVYDKDNYINEWKGQTNENKRLPASTYFYVIEFYEGENKTGWVYVSY